MTASLRPLSSFFLVVTLLFFLALDAADFPSRLAATRHQPVVEALSSFATGTRRYLLVSTIFGFIVGVIDTAALALMGVPAPIVWGVLSFITNYIPNIGFVIGLVPPATLALLSGGPTLMIQVIIVYCVVNFVIQTLIQPKIVGDSVGLAVTITFLSLVFWAWVLGPLGALLAVPLTLLLKALLVESDPEGGLNSSLCCRAARRTRRPRVPPPRSEPCKAEPGAAGHGARADDS